MHTSSAIFPNKVEDDVPHVLDVNINNEEQSPFSHRTQFRQRSLQREDTNSTFPLTRSNPFFISFRAATSLDASSLRATPAAPSTPPRQRLATLSTPHVYPWLRADAERREWSGDKDSGGRQRAAWRHVVLPGGLGDGGEEVRQR